MPDIITEDKPIEIKDFKRISEIASELSVEEPKFLPAPSRRFAHPPGVKPPELITAKKPQKQKSLLDEALKKAMARTEKNGHTVAHNLANVMVECARKGNVSMMKLIVERTGGLPTQRIEEDSSILITVERIG